MKNKLICYNNNLIRITEAFDNIDYFILTFENEEDLLKIDSFTVFINDEIIWSSDLQNTIIIQKTKMILPLGWLIKKYKDEYNNISILLKSDQHIKYNLEFKL